MGTPSPELIRWRRHNNHWGLSSWSEKKKKNKKDEKKKKLAIMWVFVVAVVSFPLCPPGGKNRQWPCTTTVCRNRNYGIAAVTMAWVSSAVSVRSKPFLWQIPKYPVSFMRRSRTSSISSSDATLLLSLHAAAPKKRKRKNRNEDEMLIRSDEIYNSNTIETAKTQRSNIRKRPIQKTTTTHATTTKKRRRFSYRTAVAIIPPDEAWDRLQQARHWVQDPTVHIWPPAIRLFHPFVDNTNDDNYDEDDNYGEQPRQQQQQQPYPQDESLYDTCIFKMAECIEQLNQTMCEITLSEWSIIPHMEAMAELWDSREDANDDSLLYETNIDQEDDHENELRYIKNLIAREEAIGKINKAKRQAKHGGRRGSGRPRKTNNPSMVPMNDDNNGEPVQEDVEATVTTPARKSVTNHDNSSSNLPKNTFDGNCVIVLEPDPPSRAILVRLRAALKQALAANDTIDTTFADMYSPTRSVKDSFYQNDNMEDDEEDFDYDDADSIQFLLSTNEWRPVIPIAAVSTTAAAIPLARHLRASWDPIRFNVTDLHVLSRRSSTSRRRRRRTGGGHGGRGRLHGEAFGCDALISFVGSEAVSMDDPIHQKLAYLVSEHGDSGGADTEALLRPRPVTSSILSTKLVLDDDDDFSEMPEILEDDDDFDENSNKNRKQNGENYISPTLEDWLFQDDADLDDDGSVVVLGRVQFFTGSQRDYVGMPAASVLDQTWYYDREHKSKQKGTNKKRLFTKGQEKDPGR